MGEDKGKSIVIGTYIPAKRKSHIAAAQRGKKFMKKCSS